MCSHNAPFLPSVKDNLDTSCIDKAFTGMKVQETIEPDSPLKAHFDGFSYNQDSPLSIIE